MSATEWSIKVCTPEGTFLLPWNDDCVIIIITIFIIIIMIDDCIFYFFILVLFLKMLHIGVLSMGMMLNSSVAVPSKTINSPGLNSK